MKPPKIVLAGDPVLRAAAAPVPPEDLGTPKLKALVASMVAAMRKAPGVGLAAPQIGVGLQVIVLEDRKELMDRLSPEDLELRGRVPLPLTVIVNPSIKVRGASIASATGADRAVFFEGCLSVPGYMALVARDLSVEVTGVDAGGAPVHLEATGWPARILQHEIDHLRGVLYVDRMLTRTLCSDAEAKRWVTRPVDEVRAAFGV